ncbi:M23 family metallopeptidase [Sphingomonas sp.]|uniref:M23 family metallopeptidase n=1 Tax=Sphingomonas sp. TaxID=28214 RepID=UPI003CC67C89
MNRCRVPPGLTLIAAAIFATAAPAGGDPAASLPSGADAQYRARMLSWVAPAATAQGGDTLLPPVALDRLSSGFGTRIDPINRSTRRHLGIDLPGAIGTPVHAAADGVVAVAGRAGGYGNLVEIEHAGGVETRYAHLLAIDVVPGMTVRQGDIVGLMGSTGRSTGSHLHFEVRIDGRAADPVAQLSDESVRALVPAPTVTARWGGWSTGDRLPGSVLR